MDKKSDLEHKNSIQKLKILYLIILIILLIFTLIVSFKTGESIYYLINTNPKGEDTDSSSSVANWNFDVRIEY